MVNLKHCASIGQKVQQARDVLKMTVSYYDRFEQLSNVLAKKEANAQMVEQTLVDLGLSVEEVKESGRKMQIKRDITNLFEHGQGNDNIKIRHTAWTLLNAVAEYTDHLRGTRVTTDANEREARLQSQWFGSGAKMKEKAFESVMKQLQIA
jgi:hypothetical protein